MIPSTLLFLSLFSIADSSSVGLVKRSDVLVGYRRVNEKQALAFNTDGLNFTGNNKVKTQLGEGLYTTSFRDAWIPDALNTWYCMIWAHSEAFKEVTKAWIPEMDDEHNMLWWEGDATIELYIKHLDRAWNPEWTIRLSIMAGQADANLQLMIPKSLIDHAGMGWKVICQEDGNDIPEVLIDYDEFDNVKGRKK